MQQNSRKCSKQVSIFKIHINAVTRALSQHIAANQKDCRLRIKKQTP